MFANKRLVDLTASDIAGLVEDQVPESKALDYKLELPANNYEAKKEFLADVTSFANAAGGHLVFGVDEQGGIPTSAPGLQVDDLEAEILRMENIIRDSIDPRIPGLSIVPIRHSEHAPFVVIGVPSSWSKPHVVNFQGHWRFYSRTASGKYPLDLGELRNAFGQARYFEDRSREFRFDRVARIVADETPVSIDGAHRTVLHLIPFGGVSRESKIDLGIATKQTWSLKPLNGSVTGSRYNLDGFVTYSSTRGGKSSSYYQLFRSGIVETLDAAMNAKKLDENVPFIPSILFEREVIETTRASLALLKSLALDPPIAVMLTLVGAKGHILAVNRRIDAWEEHRHPIDRDPLFLPETVLDEYPDDVAIAMRPLFDSLWNSAGWQRSFSYDDNGNWGKGPNAK